MHFLPALFEPVFMRSAFLVGTVVAATAGLVGYFVVLRGQTFAGDALSHVAFTGALGAAVLGAAPVLGLFGLTGAAGLSMAALGQRERARDEAVGTVLAWLLGVGALFLSVYTNVGSARNSVMGVSVLFGSIFSLQSSQVPLVVVVGLVTAIILLAMARPLLFASLDPAVAAACGVPVRFLGLAFLLLLAVTVGEAVQVVGALLIFALLVTPAAIAQRLVARPYAALALSAALAIAFTWVGLILAVFLPLPVSSVISSLAFLAYLAVRVGRRL